MSRALFMLLAVQGSLIVCGRVSSLRRICSFAIAKKEINYELIPKPIVERDILPVLVRQYVFERRNKYHHGKVLATCMSGGSFFSFANDMSLVKMDMRKGVTKKVFKRSGDSYVCSAAFNEKASLLAVTTEEGGMAL